MLRIIKVFGNLFLIPLYWLSVFIPKNKNIWVFGSWFGLKYSDNSRYLYEYVTNNEPSVRAIWLTHNKHIQMELKKQGYEVYLIRSMRGYWYGCIASVSVFTENISDTGKLATSNSIKVQLWHGIPLKKIVYDDNLHPRNLNHKKWFFLTKIKSAFLPFMDVYGKWDIVISTSPYVSKLFHTAFKVETSQIHIVGSPRNDVILNENKHSLSALSMMRNKYPNHKVIAYLPTLRINQHSLVKFINKISSSKLLEFLENHDHVLYIKLHFSNSNSRSLITTQSPRIVILSEDDLPDINLMLPWIDILITDYSSVYFDYLLLDHPIIFTPFDQLDYTQNDRELYDSYDVITPGPICTTWNEVTNYLLNLSNGCPDEYKDQRNKLKNKYHTYMDTQNSQRITEVIKKQLH